MTKLLKIALCVAAMAVLVVSVAGAGQNAGGTAKIYWLAATSSTVGSASRDASGATVQGLVTGTGINVFRGADVQLVINAFDASGLPQAWQAYTGGPADGCWTPKIGGFRTGAVTIFTNVFTASTAVPGQAVGQGGGILFGLTGASSCVTPHDVGVAWMSVAGSAGVARLATREYGVFGFQMDFTVVPGLLGGPDDPAGAASVCINPNWRLPCGSGEKGNVFVTVDATGTKDYLTFLNGFQYLTYASNSATPGCPLSTPVRNTTWGHVRNLYK